MHLAQLLLSSLAKRPKILNLRDFSSWLELVFESVLWRMSRFLALKSPTSTHLKMKELYCLIPSICTYTYIHVYIYTCIHLYICIHLYTYKCLCICIHIYKCIHLYMYINTYICLYIYTWNIYIIVSQVHFIFFTTDKQSDSIWKKSPKCICHY